MVNHKSHSVTDFQHNRRTRRFSTLARAIEALGDTALPVDASAHQRAERQRQKAAARLRSCIPAAAIVS